MSKYDELKKYYPETAFKRQDYENIENVPIYFIPEILPNENFEMITDQVAPGIAPYYSISNYGRIWNIPASHFTHSS